MPDSTRPPADAAIIVAGDPRLGFALHEPPPGWKMANPARLKDVAAALTAGAPVALDDEFGWADWLRAGTADWAEYADLAVRVTEHDIADETALIFHPPVLAVGIGCERDCPIDEIAALATETLQAAGLALAAVAAVASVALKAGEPGVHALAGRLGVPARFFPAERLLDETPRLSARSEAVFRATGCWGVAESAALAAAGPYAELIVPKRRSRGATCAIARAARPIDPTTMGRT